MYVGDFRDFGNSKALSFDEFSRLLRPPIPACSCECPLSFEEVQEGIRRHHAPTRAEVEEAERFDENDPLFLAWLDKSDSREFTLSWARRDLFAALRDAHDLGFSPDEIASIYREAHRAWNTHGEWYDLPSQEIVDRLNKTVPEPIPAKPQECGLSHICDPLEQLTHAPGLIGEIVNWIEASALRPNRVLALGTALTVVGTLIGRRVAGPTRSATHLYVIGLARTGAGKQHVHDCAKELLDVAGARQHVGPSEFISGPAVINSLMRMPLLLCLQDEFGSLLKRINNKKASGFEAQIRKFLLELWGLSFKAYDTPEWAGRRSETVYTPALSLFGLSTHDDFFTALRSSDLPGGFINRFLLLSSDKRACEQDPALHAVPEPIAQDLQTLYQWRQGNPMNGAQLMNPNLKPQPDVRPWASGSAKQMYDEFKREIEARIDGEPSLENFISRSPEIAIRLATIVAAGRWVGNYDFTVDRSDVEWGVAVARASADRMIIEASERMVEETPTYGEAANKLLRIVKGLGRIEHSELLRKMQPMKAKDVKEIIATFIESGMLNKEVVRPKDYSGGTCPTFYRMVKR